MGAIWLSGREAEPIARLASHPQSHVVSSAVPLGLKRSHVWGVALLGLCAAAGSWLGPWYNLSSIGEPPAEITFWNSLGWVVSVLVIAVVLGLLALVSMLGTEDFRPRVHILAWGAIAVIAIATLISIYRTAHPPTITCRFICIEPVFHPSQLSAGTLPFLSDIGLGVALVGLWLLRPPLVLPVAITGGIERQLAPSPGARSPSPPVPPVESTAQQVAEAEAQVAAEHSETKVCPDCAETVKSAARVCKHCGFRFDG